MVLGGCPDPQVLVPPGGTPVLTEVGAAAPRRDPSPRGDRTCGELDSSGAGGDLRSSLCPRPPAPSSVGRRGTVGNQARSP